MSYRENYIRSIALGGRIGEVAARRLAVLDGLDDQQVRAAEAEARYMCNLAGWRPSDALATAAAKLREGRRLSSLMAQAIMTE